MFVFNGGMVDVTPEKASVDAIIEAGYPGMLGGQAVAATIFGENDHLGECCTRTGTSTPLN